jgi:hypothetical protein
MATIPFKKDGVFYTNDSTVQLNDGIYLVWRAYDITPTAIKIKGFIHAKATTTRKAIIDAFIGA